MLFLLFAGEVLGPKPVDSVHNAYWVRSPLDVVSLVPKKASDGKKQAQDFAEELQKSKEERFSDYKPEKDEESDIVGQFKIVATLRDLYRVVQNNTKKAYTVIVRNAATTLIRNNFIAKLLDAYTNREKIFAPDQLEESQRKVSLFASSQADQEKGPNKPAKKFIQLMEETYGKFTNAGKVCKQWVCNPENRQKVVCVTAFCIVVPVILYNLLWNYLLRTVEPQQEDNSLALVPYRPNTKLITCSEVAQWLQLYKKTLLDGVFWPPFNQTVGAACVTLVAQYYDLLALLFQWSPRENDFFLPPK